MNIKILKLEKKLRAGSMILVLALFTIAGVSFTTIKLGDDFLKHLGITKTSADERITLGLIHGTINIYGIKNLKNIALNNRTAITLDILDYTKKYTATPEFKKAYTELKQYHTPKENKIQSPEEMRAGMIASTKKSIADSEANLKKADATMKPIIQQVLDQSIKMLKEAEDPNNKQIAGYAKMYPDMVAANRQQYEAALKKWEETYPANHMLFVKKKLSDFLVQTSDIDFNAELVERNGKKIFVNKTYEGKGAYWKMAFRAGKEVIEPARKFATAWMAEIN